MLRSSTSKNLSRIGRILVKSSHKVTASMEPNSNVDILRPLSESELLNLINLYKRKGEPYHCMSIFNHYRWNRHLDATGEDASSKCRALKKTYFTHKNGDLLKNGTYISFQCDKLLCLQFHTLEESMKELKECIIESKLIDWTSGRLLTGICTHIADVIVPLIKRIKGENVEYEIPCTCFSLRHQLALRIQIPNVPEGFELRPLEERHAAYIHSNWPHNDEASVDFIRGLIRYNLTLGVFRLRDERLIGWVLQNEFFGLGILQVITEEQGKGFAKLLTKAMSQRIAIYHKNDITSFAVVDNTRSESILTKVGYEKRCVTKWVQLEKHKLRNVDPYYRGALSENGSLTNDQNKDSEYYTTTNSLLSNGSARNGSTSKLLFFSQIIRKFFDNMK